MYGEVHCHFLMNGVNFKQAIETHKNGVKDEFIHRYFKAYIEKDIHYLRDGGDNLGVSKRAKELAKDYDLTYRSPIFAIHKNGYYGGIVGRGFDTIEEYKNLVLEVKREGGDFIKFMSSGILDFNEFGKVSTPLDDFSLINEMVHIAHEEGFAVMTHVNTPRQIRYALLAGADSIEHGYYMDDECIRLLIETRAVWVPTVTTICNLIGTGRFDEKNVAQIAKSHQTAIKKAVELGALVAVGSDAGAVYVPHAQGTVDEVKWLREAVGDDEKLFAVLDKGEQMIKRKF
ncbi:Aryldialkylphosphatase related protein [Lachnospiraceae bacterium TWA4]|nr:Aryldialkylphosphatase related protein [Lachnospiraceae bacterium TWA4]